MSDQTTAKITDSEMEVLLCLRERVKGFGLGFGLSPDTLCQALGIDGLELARRASFLAGFHLTHVELINTTALDSGDDDPMIDTVSLTSLGENLLRQIEEQPGIARKLTLQTYRSIGAAALNAARVAMAELIKAMMQSALRG